MQFFLELDFEGTQYQGRMEHVHVEKVFKQ